MAAEPKLWACAADVANRQTRRAYTLIFFIIINYYFKFRKLPLRYPNYLNSPEADFKVSLNRDTTDFQFISIPSGINWLISLL